jgi:hypothetical protein
MKYTTVKISEILQHPTMRLDAKYWIRKKPQAASGRVGPRAASLTRRILNDRVKTMKEITYKNKKIKLPFPDADYSDQPLEMEEVKNPFSGQSIAMPKFAVAVYDVTMGSNHLAEAEDHELGMGASKHWPTVRKGLDWFRRYFAKEYMVLLD